VRRSKNCTVATNKLSTGDNVGVAWCAYVESYRTTIISICNDGLDTTPPAGLMNVVHLMWSGSPF
jgi:hypothetical protein